MNKSENRADLPVQTAEDREYSVWLEAQRKWVDNYLKKRVRSDGDCEDLTQDVFRRAWQFRNDWRGIGSRSSWLLRITINLLNNYYIRKIRIQDRLTPLENIEGIYSDDVKRESEWACPYERVDNQLYVKRLMAAVTQACTPMQKCVVLLNYQGESYERIETLLGMESGMARLHFFRGRELLLAYLAENEPDLIGGRERLAAEWEKMCSTGKLEDRPGDEERKAWENPGKYKKIYRSLLLKLVKNLPLPILLSSLLLIGGDR